AWKIGLAGVYLGVGRNTTSDKVSPDVGFIFRKVRGDRVEKDDVIAEVYGKDEASLLPALELSNSALTIGAKKPAPTPLILEEISVS
ncbi:MAG: thymidine phosphorylase, partial [Rectinema sp.]